MTMQIKAPAMGESIAEATVAKWLKNVGDAVQADELVAELETDKVNLEVSAPVAGVLTAIMTPAGAMVKVGDLMAELQEAAAAAPAAAPKVAMATAPVTSANPATGGATGNLGAASYSDALGASGPAVKKMVSELGADMRDVAASGKDGRFTKADVAGAPVAPQAGTGAAAHVAAAPTGTPPAQGGVNNGTRAVNRVPMTRIRKTIASRLKQAQNTAAMLTTWNEVDLFVVNGLRAKYKEAFEKRHGAKLGYMGFFTKAVVDALKEWPALNAEIDGEELVYKQYYDIGIAVSSEKGLVVPVVRGADAKSLAEIEKDIVAYGKKARDGGLKPDELQGATFSITNGGVFGSLMSMPILNYPQVGILGMHAIKERPVVVDGDIKIRPMMYLALTYDHRIVDGKEAVSFLVRVKENLEDPARLVLGM